MAQPHPLQSVTEHASLKQLAFFIILHWQDRQRYQICRPVSLYPIWMPTVWSQVLYVRSSMSL